MNGKDFEHITSKLAQIAKGARAKLIAALGNDPAWKKDCTRDEDETAASSGCDVPDTADEWMHAVKSRPKMWLNGDQITAGSIDV